MDNQVNLKAMLVFNCALWPKIMPLLSPFILILFINYSYFSFNYSYSSVLSNQSQSLQQYICNA